MDKDIQEIFSKMADAETLLLLVAYICRDHVEEVPTDIWCYPYVIGHSKASDNLKRAGFITTVPCNGMATRFAITALGSIIVKEYMVKNKSMQTILGTSESKGVMKWFDFFKPMLLDHLKIHSDNNPRELWT